MTKFWLVMSGVVIFAAGSAVGFLAFRGVAPWVRTDSTWPPLAPILEPRYLLTSEDVYSQLELDEHQRQMINFLLSMHSKRVSELRCSMSDLAVQLRDGVNAALTADQRKKLADIQEGFEERDVQEHANRELRRWRVDLSLTPDQEGRVYTILLDTARERRQLFHSEPRDRSIVRKKMEETGAKRDACLAKVLSESQLGKYREIKDREKQCFKSKEDHLKKGAPGEPNPQYDGTSTP